MSTRSEPPTDVAALSHFASFGKSRKTVFTAAPPVTAPEKTRVVTIKVHIE
jgi:hypothetical protein